MAKPKPENEMVVDAKALKEDVAEQTPEVGKPQTLGPKHRWWLANPKPQRLQKETVANPEPLTLTGDAGQAKTPKRAVGMSTTKPERRC